MIEQLYVKYTLILKVYVVRFWMQYCFFFFFPLCMNVIQLGCIQISVLQTNNGDLKLMIWHTGSRCKNMMDFLTAAYRETVSVSFTITALKELSPGFTHCYNTHALILSNKYHARGQRAEAVQKQSAGKHFQTSFVKLSRGRGTRWKRKNPSKISWGMTNVTTNCQWVMMMMLRAFQEHIHCCCTDMIDITHEILLYAFQKLY